jgi:putative two-component system response regulator
LYAAIEIEKATMATNAARESLLLCPPRISEQQSMNARADSMTGQLKIAITQGLQRTALERAEDLISRALQTGTCPDAKLLLETALELETFDVDKKRQLKLILDAARFFYISGKPESGLTLGISARELAVEIADATSAGAALTVVGICAADTGNLPMAMEAYSDALSLAQKNNDLVREGKTWQNLGVALMYGGLFREAIECYQRALTFTKRVKDLSPFAAALHTNIALCYLHLDEIAQGLTAVNKAVELSCEPADANAILDRILMENNFVRLLIEIDDFEGARAHAKTARHYASMTQSPRADIFASVAEGLAEVFSGHADVGISRLTATFERAVSLKVTSRDVLVALVKAHEHIGQHDKALEYLNMMLEQQRKTQAANVLQHVKRHLEQLHVADKDSQIEDASQIIKKLLTRAEVFEGRVAKSELQKRDQQLFVARVEVMERLAVAATLCEDRSGERVYRVGRLASLLAHMLGEDDHTVFRIEIATRLYDIGKGSIPDSIRHKVSAYTPGEFGLMKMHTVIGAELLAKSEIAELQMAEQIARYHHEHWDGSGYPEGLKGEAIPLPARVVALADVFDALTHARAYRAAFTIDAAIEEINKGRGTQFEPRLVDPFIKLIQLLRREQIADAHGNVPTNLDDLLGQSAKASPLLLARQKIWASIDSVTEAKQALLATPKQPETSSEKSLTAEQQKTAKLIETLTPTEREVFKWVQLGKTNPEIAQILGSRTFTIKTHVQRIYSKLGVSSRVGLARLGLGASSRV